MQSVTHQKQQNLYDQDFFGWTEEIVRLLKSQQWHELDLENLIEEVVDLGKSQQRALQSSLRLVLMHLLKWQYQPERRSHSWEVTITRERLNLDELLQESPSLQRFLQDDQWVNATYQRSRREAMVETSLGEEIFPSTCPFTTAEIVDLDFYPDSEEASFSPESAET
ncbi:MAG: DUF29 domain-containing protein [Leptolyngbyaceae bacterium]|nr:DUF29 domain-containing protein [Leptolyngbyaceae bacterium]